MLMQKLSVIILMLVFVCNGLLQAQTEPYANMIFPFKVTQHAGRRMVGATVALRNQIPNVAGNPAGLAKLKQSMLAVGIGFVYDHFNYKPEIEQTSLTRIKTQTTLPDLCAASIHFRLFQRDWNLALNYYGKQKPLFENCDTPNLENIDQLTMPKESYFKTVALGLGVQVIPHLDFGVGWTYWSGRFTWNSLYLIAIPPGYYGEQTGDFNYDGNYWHLGVLSEFRRVSLGAVFYLPQKILTVDAEIVPDIAYKMNQKFKGAFIFGSTYKLQPHWQVELNYGWQAGSVYQYAKPEIQADQNYGASSMFSLGSEYVIKLGNLQLPVSAGYKIIRLPAIPNQQRFFVETFTVNRNYVQIYQFGGSILFDRFGLYYSVQLEDASWSQRGTQVPPWS